MAATRPIPVNPPTRADLDALRALAIREPGRSQPAARTTGLSGAYTGVLAGARVRGGPRGGTFAPNGTAAGGNFR